MKDQNLFSGKKKKKNKTSFVEIFTQSSTTHSYENFESVNLRKMNIFHRSAVIENKTFLFKVQIFF